MPDPALPGHRTGPPPPPPRVIGAVLCGGRSPRFGSDKALAPAGDLLVGQRVVAALRAAGVDPVAAIGGSAGPRIGVPTIADLRPGDGPLAGLATALLWAKTGPVVVVPCDLVLLQGAHVSALLAAAVVDPKAVTVATVGGSPQVSLACWPAEHGRSVLQMLDRGEHRFHRALDELGWVGVELPPDAVADADTPAQLDRLLGRRSD